MSDTPIRRELQRIVPRTALRAGFFLGLLFGLYSAWVLKGLGETNAGLISAAESEQLKAIGGGSSVLLCCISALVGALVHSLIFGLAAVVYNLSAKWFGGIEFVTEDATETPADSND
jgi:preprotein translocase subunit Sec61beta